MLSLCRYTCHLLYGCLLAATTCVLAADPVPVPEQTTLLVDQAGALTPDARESLLTRLQSMQASGRAQVAILISGGLGAEPLSDYALRVAEAWQLGRAQRDDGLLILVVPAINGARIEVGYGLEGDIPDARASQWLDELIPAMKQGRLAAGLDHLLDEIDKTLPDAKSATGNDGTNYLFPDHPEWRLPFVLVVFSLFSVMPLMLGRWGSIVSALMLAAFYGGAAWTLWDSQTAGLIVAAIAFPLPLLWGLNWADDTRLPAVLQYAKAFGNMCAVLLFFSILTLFVGVAIWASGAEEIWAAPIFGGMLALGLAAFLFPRAQRPIMIVLRSDGHFIVILTLAYVGLQPVVAHPADIALPVAIVFTALIALALYLDVREQANKGATRWSLWLIGLALLIALPFGLLLIVEAVLGGDFYAHLGQAAAGGGSVGAAIWWAVRHGFFTALKVGLGGRFGGGGAGRSDS